MVDFNKVAGVVWWLALTMYYILESLVMRLIPAHYRKKNLRGNVVVVTGGGSGIGRLMCLKLAAKGAIVVSWDVSEEGNNETVQQVKAAGGQCRGFQVDLCNRHEVYAAANKVKQEVGKVDILINNAGIVTGKNLLLAPDTSIIKTFEVNTISHFWTVKAFLGDMMVRNKGHIVTIASSLGKSALNGLTDYCSSKFAAVGFTEALSLELKAMGKSGIKTTLVCPGGISTGMFDGVIYDDWLSPDYVAKTVVEAVELNTNEVVIPKALRFHFFLQRFLPEKAYFKMLELQGLTRCMDGFVGRKKTY